MTIESVTYISDLNSANPAAGDAKSEGDDHIRNIKASLKTTFPNIAGVMSATHSELSGVAAANLAEAIAGVAAAANWNTTGSSLRKVTKDFAVLNLLASATGAGAATLVTLQAGYRPIAIVYAAATFFDVSTGLSHAGYIQISTAGAVQFFSGSGLPWPAAAGDFLFAAITFKLA